MDVDEQTISNVSVDEIQNQVDALMLSIFEAMRNEASKSADEVSTEILQKYRKLNKSIDNLIGINRTKESQEIELLRISNVLQARRDTILSLEQSLLQRNSDISKKLSQIL